MKKSKSVTRKEVNELWYYHWLNVFFTLGGLAGLFSLMALDMGKGLYFVFSFAIASFCIGIYFVMWIYKKQTMKLLN